MGAFLFFGAAMASLACFTLLVPGTFLDRAWRLNPKGYEGLAPLGWRVGAGFLALAMCLALAAVGWLRRRQWAWWLATAIIAIQVLANIFSLFLGRFAEGAVGVTIASALFLYLVSTKVRAAFRSS